MIEPYSVPRVGLALAVRRNGYVLLHKRKGKHAPGMYAFPGGHLELNESFEDCALRELAEEAGHSMRVTQPEFWCVENVFFRDNGRHYVTIFMACDYDNGFPEIMEPDKCEEWRWTEWGKAPREDDRSSGKFFIPIQNLLKQGYHPFH